MARDLGRRTGRWLSVTATVVGITLLAYWLYGALYVGPPVSIAIAPERAAIGAPTEIRATFRETKRGLTTVRLLLLQAGRSVELASEAFAPPSPWKPWSKGATMETTLAGVAGRDAPEWLREGTATIRAEAERITGSLRNPRTEIAELTMAVRLQPPSLMVLSNQHYVRQGGSGVVVFRVGETAVRSGVVAGEREFASYPLPEAAEQQRFALFGVPWDLSSEAEIRLFAEDDAGNRTEATFIDAFRPAPPRRDVIHLPDSFLERVVPAIVSETPSLRAEGSLLDQYLAINGALRRANRAFIAELSERSGPELLWRGPFLQLPNSGVRARYAQVRTYLYNGEKVDEQTHLGLDFASVARAPVPAPNSGVVLYVGYLGIYGNVVVLDHGGGMISISAHLSSTSVTEGQKVAKGDPIGRTGATGLAGGDHLHLGVFIQDTAVDPVEWLDAKWIKDNIGTKLPLPH